MNSLGHPEHAAPVGHWSRPQWGSRCGWRGWSQLIGPQGWSGCWWRDWCRNVDPLTASPPFVSHLAETASTCTEVTTQVSPPIFSTASPEVRVLPKVWIWTPSLHRVWVHWGTSGNAPWPAKQSAAQEGRERSKNALGSIREELTWTQTDVFVFLCQDVKHSRASLIWTTDFPLDPIISYQLFCCSALYESMSASLAI